MFVDLSNYESVRAKIFAAPAVAIDCETTGLYPWQDDRLFAISCATEHEEFYFDFRSWGLPRHLICDLFGELFTLHKSFYFLNAKFDLAFLYQEGAKISDLSLVFDAEVLARLLENDLLSTSMESLAPWVGLAKDKSLEKWARENGAWRWEQHDDGTRSRRILYHEVPLAIVGPYAEMDARITYNLCRFILANLKQQDDERPDHQPSILGVLNTEVATTKVLFDMEKEGVLTNPVYVEQAFVHESEKWQEATCEFQLMTGMAFKNSGKCLGEAFEKFAPDDKPHFKYTPTGQFQTTDEVLSSFTSPLAQVVKDYRNSYKRAGTYFANYKSLADRHGRVHPSFRQSGTRSGRLSCGSPNLQNVTKSKDKESRYPIRRAFIPPPGFLWLSIDYKSMEYYLFMDYAGEEGLIKLVLAGADVHQATAELVGVDRQRAKMINFLLLYGGGDQKLADALGIPLHEARQLKLEYFAKLPKIERVIRQIIKQAETRKYLHAWDGRVFKFPDSRFAYKAPNYLIQGGCAGIVKKAMVGVQELLHERKARTKMILQVHDSLEFYLHPEELDLVPEIRSIMEKAYPSKRLPMATSVEVGSHSWADLEDLDKWTSTQAVS